MAEETPALRAQRNEPAIRIVMMPPDTNAEGSVFGGVILSNIDLAAFVEAKRQAHNRYVTVSMKEVVFKAPVFVGDTLSFYAEAIRLGRTSITIKVKVVAERFEPPTTTVNVTEAEVVMVAMDDSGHPKVISPMA